MRGTTTRWIPLVSAILLLTASSQRSQSIQDDRPAGISEQVLLGRSLLLSDLQGLESRAAKLDKPLARALAKAEIADAAWTLDRDWSKKLLRDAYRLTFPEEAEQVNLRSIPVGAPLTLPTSLQIAQNKIRNRILDIARRDKGLADELAQLGARTLGKREEHHLYSSLAAQSIEAGDDETASSYILKAIDADPTLLNAGMMIFQMAARDRKAADNLIVQYIDRLRVTAVSQSNGSALRTYMFLKDLVTNNSKTYLMLLGGNTGSQGLQIQPPGPIVMRAYVSYVIDSLGALEQREPGSARRFRAVLLSAWLPLNQYAPQLSGAFLQLEKLSRTADEDASLPTGGDQKSGGSDTYEQRVKKALDSDQPDDLIINMAIGRGDFDKARKMIDKLPDGAHKSELIESVNTHEAVELAEKGEIGQAAILAERLSRAASILQVYPVLLKKCLSGENAWRATPLVYQAIKQLKKADTAVLPPPRGIPETMITAKGPDPIPLSLSKLAKSVVEVDETLALAVLDETVIAANKTSVDSSEGGIGFDLDVFKQLAPKNEPRVRQAAEDLSDHFRQIVALAAINQWKASELEKKSRIDLTKSKAR